MKRFFVLFVLLMGIPARASDLVAPFTLENSQTLPGGVHNFRFFDLAMQLDTRFTGAGGFQPLGYRLNKAVKWQDVVDSQNDAAQKNLVRGILRDKGLAETGSPGDATGMVNVVANVKVPVLAMGLTDRLTVGLIVPVVTLDAKVDTGFRQARTGDGQKFISAVCEQSPAQCNDAADKLNRATQSKLARLNYAPLADQSVTALGDLQVMGQYRWLGDAQGGLSTRLILTIPTGIGPNADHALDLATGDGRFKVGPAVIWDYRPAENLRWNLFASYTALLPNQMARRLPAAADDELSDEKADLVRQWGELLAAGTSVSYFVEAIAVRAGAGYTFQYLSQVRYQGNATDNFTQQRYRWLEALDPAQTLHSAIATVGFSSVDWYLKKKFPLPFEVNLAFSHPFAGTNAPTNDVIAGEAVLFF